MGGADILRMRRPTHRSGMLRTSRRSVKVLGSESHLSVGGESILDHQ